MTPETPKSKMTGLLTGLAKWIWAIPINISPHANRAAIRWLLSRLRKSECPPENRSAIPKMAILKAFEPYIPAAAKSCAPILIAVAAAVISGSVVTKATANTPMKLSEMPEISAIC